MTPPNVPPGTPLPPAHTILWIRVAHQGQTHRLGPIQCARSFTCDELKERLTSRFGLHAEKYDVVWIDDDNTQSTIVDDLSFFDAMGYFTPAAITSTWTPAAATSKVTSPGGNANAISSNGTTSTIPQARASIEMHVNVKVYSRISLSDFAPSSAGSVSGASSYDGDSSRGDAESWHYGKMRDGEEPPLVYRTGAGSSWSLLSGAPASSWSHHEADAPNGRYEASPSQSITSSSRYQDIGRGHSTGEDNDEDDDDQGTEYAFSGEGSLAARHTSHRPGSIVRRLTLSAPNLVVHKGSTCVVCGVSPIAGIRYICVMCDGVPSICGFCEDAGRSIQYAPHLATHAMLKLVEPMASRESSIPGSSSGSEVETQSAASSWSPSHHDSSIAITLMRAANTLTLSHDRETHDRLDATSHPLPLLLPNVVSYGHDVLCSFCSERIVDGPRYICANCPLDLPTPPSASPTEMPDGEALSPASPSSPSPQAMILTPHEGFNLCSACEQHSLSIHDSDHFFIKIPGSASIARSTSDKGITPLRLNPYLTIDHRTQGLLPVLYQDDDVAWKAASRRMRGEQDRVAPTGTASASSGASATPRTYAVRTRASSDSAPSLTVHAYPPLSDSRRVTSPASASRNASPPTDGRHSSEMAYVKSLEHQSLMCDLCFEPIRGCWLRCANCKRSFDICSSCEQEAIRVHEPNHSFALFKRYVDLDLFKSLVDHIDGGVDPALGPGRPMLPFLLV